jgi:hypothetical protein
MPARRGPAPVCPVQFGYAAATAVNHQGQRRHRCAEYSLLAQRGAVLGVVEQQAECLVVLQMT